MFVGKRRMFVGKRSDELGSEKRRLFVGKRDIGEIEKRSVDTPAQSSSSSFEQQQQQVESGLSLRH